MFSEQSKFSLAVKDQTGKLYPSRFRWTYIPLFLLLLSSTLSAQEEAPKEAAAPPAAPAVQPVTQYQTLPVPEALSGNTADANRTRNRFESQIRAILRGDLDFDDDANKNLFTNWYTRYIFPSMTQPVNFAKMDVVRQKFVRQDLGFAKNPKVHDYLVNDLTLPEMTKIVRGNFYPAVRYNAMLIIANLNQVEMPTTGQRTPPIPLISALKVMVDELQNDQQSDAVHLAAWIGVLRHAELNRINQRIPLEGVKVIRDIASSLLTQKNPAAGRSVSGHVWMQRRATEVLAALGTADMPRGPLIAAQIQALAADDQVPLSLRLTAARSLGKLQYGAGAKVTPQGVATNLGALAAFICRAEMERVERQKLILKQAEGVGQSGLDSMMGGDETGMDGMEGDEMSDMFGDPEGGAGGLVGSNLSEEQIEELNQTKRMLKYQLYYVQRGLGSERMKTGLFAVPDEAGKVQVKRIADMVNGILAELEPPKPEEGKPLIVLDRDQLLQKLRKQVRQLEALTAKQSAVAPKQPADGALPGVDGVPKGKQG